MRVLPVLISIGTACAMLAAQNDAWAPPVHAKRSGNNGYASPGNNTKGRSQNIYSTADLPPAVMNKMLNKIGYRGTQYPSLVNAAQPAKTLPAVQLGIGNTTTPGTGLTNTYATNVPPGVTIVFPTAPVSFPICPPVGALAEVRAETMIFPFNTPKLFTGPHLFIEFTMSDPVNVNLAHWADALDNTAALVGGHNVVRGQGGCGVLGAGLSTLLRAPTAANGNQLGATTTYTLTSATVSSPMLFIVGTNLNNPFGLPAPINLAIINAPGCALWNSAEIALPGSTTAAGGASLPVAIPNNLALNGVEFGMQVLVISPGFNPANLTTSNGIGAYIGSRYPLTSSWLYAATDLAVTGTLYNRGAQIVHLYW